MFLKGIALALLCACRALADPQDGYVLEPSADVEEYPTDMMFDLEENVYQYDKLDQNEPAYFNLAPFRRPVTIGLYEGYKSVYEREKEYGVQFDHVLLFQSVDKLNYPLIKQYFNNGHDVILNIEFMAPTAVLYGITVGNYDKYLYPFAEAVRKGAHPLTVRTLHEFNGGWYPWGIQYTGKGPKNTVELFEKAWLRIVNIFRIVGAPVKWQLNLNNINGNDDPRPLAYYMPKSPAFWNTVDAVGLTIYNRAFLLPSRNWSETFSQAFDKGYKELAAMTDKPIIVCETGTVGYGTDKKKWYKDAWKSMALQYPRVTQITWFLVDKVEEGKVANWDLGYGKDAWISGYYDFKGITGN